MALKFEKLSATHDRGAFDCGVEPLNQYLKTQAMQQARKNISRTFVLIDHDHPQNILGYYTTTLPNLEIDLLPQKYSKKLPKYPVPTMKLARLAVNTAEQGKGYGKILILEFMRQALEVAPLVPLVCLTVDAKDESLRQYYKKMGFIDLITDPVSSLPPEEENSLSLFIMIEEVESLFSTEV